MVNNKAPSKIIGMDRALVFHITSKILAFSSFFDNKNVFQTPTSIFEQLSQNDPSFHMSTRSTQYTEIGVDNIKTLFGTKEYRLYMTKDFGIEWEECYKAESTLKNVFKTGFRVRFLRDNTNDIIDQAYMLKNVFLPGPAFSTFTTIEKLPGIHRPSVYTVECISKYVSHNCWYAHALL